MDDDSVDTFFEAVMRVAPGLSLTSQIRGPIGPVSSPTALYVALIPHSPFINASGVTLTKF
jgi:hypothetical protein